MLASAASPLFGCSRWGRLCFLLLRLGEGSPHALLMARYLCQGGVKVVLAVGETEGRRAGRGRPPQRAAFLTSSKELSHSLFPAGTSERSIVQGLLSHGSIG